MQISWSDRVINVHGKQSKGGKGHVAYSKKKED